MDLVNPIVRRYTAEADADFAAFWARAADELPWFRRWDGVFVADPPTFRWFVGGRRRTSPTAPSTVHVAAGHGGRAALIATRRARRAPRLTYAELLAEVGAHGRGAARPRDRQGDRITIYMPTCPRRSC